MNRLEPILATTRAELERRRVAVPLAELERAGAARRGGEDRRAFAQALRRPGLSLIAEHKRRSPSAGPIRDGSKLEQVVSDYERGGAAALSILTERESFAGSLEDLRAARRSSALPILRKDFIIDPYQLHESLAGGADAVLLIVAALAQQQLTELHALAGELGLAALVEIHDRDELERALGAGAEIIGINNRDLSTLQVDARRTFELAPLLPSEAVKVAESGFSSPAELAELPAAGIDAVLVGEALMRAEDVEQACARLSGIV